MLFVLLPTPQLWVNMGTTNVLITSTLLPTGRTHLTRFKNFSYSSYRQEDEVFQQFAFNHTPNLLQEMWFVNAGTAGIYGDEIEAV